jgi:hypothetical protein
MLSKDEKCEKHWVSALHLENEETRCRQLQGGESADSLVFYCYEL